VRAPPLLGVEGIEVFTTRPDTLFGVSFLTLAPEHELVQTLTTATQRAEVEAYVKTSTNRSERERQAEVDKVSGVFTGSYAKHPFTGKEVPVWVGDYVLGGYGTGAVMAVPGGDQRDWNFATHFGLPIIAVTEGADIRKEADERKDAIICSEGFLQGLAVPEAITRAIDELVKLGAGERRINYRLRDAAFGRQRYWGEPIPIYYKDGVPYALPESELPLKLPEVDKFLPTEDGEPPLARAANWSYQGHPLETTTMPGWAGSSWYFLRYMDPQNEGRFASPEAIDYWQQIDLYVGGSEHATGHLLYFRFWTKFLHDRGYINFDEPAKKLVNQGMIQAKSRRCPSQSSTWSTPTTSLKNTAPTRSPLRDVPRPHRAEQAVGHQRHRGHLPLPAQILEPVLRERCVQRERRGAHRRPSSKSAARHLEEGDGGHREDELQHQRGQFMIAVNELGALKCHKRDVLEPLTIALAPFAPHIAEELWQKLGHATSITTAIWPKWDAQHLVEDNFSYPISFNGKTRLQLEFPIALDAKSVEAAVLANPEVQQRLEGKAPKKVIVVPKRIVNIVV
jgi:leucyl-tRNA synthetase